MTQKDFAAKIGKTRNAFVKYELGLAMPNAETLLKIQKIEKQLK